MASQPYMLHHGEVPTLTHASRNEDVLFSLRVSSSPSPANDDDNDEKESAECPQDASNDGHHLRLAHFRVLTLWPGVRVVIVRVASVNRTQP